jgi:hypothetical protein
MMIGEILGIIGAGLNFAVVIPYLIATRKGDAKPNAVSWLTWTQLTVIAAAASLTVGDSKAAWVLMGDALGTGLIFLAGLRWGYAKMTAFDAFCQFVALTGVASWIVLHTAWFAVLLVIATDVAALLPTLRHAYRQPDEEVTTTYLLSTIGSFCGLVTTLHSFSIQNGLYLAYLVVANSAVAATVTVRRRYAKNQQES